MTITPDQLAQLQDKVKKLSDHKALADQATADSNVAHATLQSAQADVAQKDAAESAADSVVTTDLNDLRTFIDSLVTPINPPAGN